MKSLLHSTLAFAELGAKAPYVQLTVLIKLSSAFDHKRCGFTSHQAARRRRCGERLLGLLSWESTRSGLSSHGGSCSAHSRAPGFMCACESPRQAVGVLLVQGQGSGLKPQGGPCTRGNQSGMSGRRQPRAAVTLPCCARAGPLPFFCF